LGNDEKRFGIYLRRVLFIRSTTRYVVQQCHRVVLFCEYGSFSKYLLEGLREHLQSVGVEAEVAGYDYPAASFGGRGKREILEEAAREGIPAIHAYPFEDIVKDTDPKTALREIALKGTDWHVWVFKKESLPSFSPFPGGEILSQIAAEMKLIAQKKATALHYFKKVYLGP
jgi:hypothetical protein